MVGHILLAAVVSVVIMSLLWFLRGLLLTPVRPGENERLYIVLHVSGPTPALEQTVDSLLWLIEDGVLPAELALEDGGMDDDPRRTAQLLVRRHTKVTLWTKNENCMN